MKHIVVFGAGKSSIFLLEYLIVQLAPNNWKLTVLDADHPAAQAKIGHTYKAEALFLDVTNELERKKHVASADIVISLLPPSLHYYIALDCLQFGKNLLTASYIDPNIEKLRDEITRKGLLFLCETGLDPGIDHMSAMKIIHSLQRQGAGITYFRSHCGGLVAPESDDNPWRYKISWNPKNVVLAGKSGAIYRENGQEVRLPYEKMFDPKRQVIVKGLDALSYYPNRDSLAYIDLYNLHGVSDFIRTTLRYPPFCSGWQKIIELKLTDDDYRYETNGKTLKSFFADHFDKYGFGPDKYAPIREQLAYLGLHDDLTTINKESCTAADVLQFIMENKLRLQQNDRDMIVMLHEVGYSVGNELKSLHATLILKGENGHRTAMAKTVGLPLGIAAKLILQEKIKVKGLHIPIISEIYEPVLMELQDFGIDFIES